VKSTEMLELLREFHCDKATQRQGHAAAAEYVAHYDYNNTYQYVIAREDMHLRWLIDAIVDLGSEPENVPVPKLTPAGKGTEAQRSVIARDRDSAGQFIEKWRSRIDSLPNARHRTLLHVILGETLEHKRFFDMALAGRTDLLGRRADGAGTGGGVLPTRWLGGEQT
jgi:hypothetical protein